MSADGEEVRGSKVWLRVGIHWALETLGITECIYSDLRGYEVNFNIRGYWNDWQEGSHVGQFFPSWSDIAE